MGEVYIDQGMSEEEWQAEARSHAVERREGYAPLMPKGSYWMTFYDEHYREIYGFWMQRQRRWLVRDSADDTFVVKSLRSGGLEHRALYFEIGDTRGKEAEYGYGLNLQTSGSSPLQWLWGQMRNIKDRAENKRACLNAPEWFFVDTDQDSRSGRRLRIPATMIREIVVCKYRPSRRIGAQEVSGGFDRCGSFPYPGQSLGEWIEDVSGEDGSDRRSRKSC